MKKLYGLLLGAAMLTSVFTKVPLKVENRVKNVAFAQTKEICLDEPNSIPENLEENIEEEDAYVEDEIPTLTPQESTTTTDLKLHAKSAYMIDSASGTLIYSHNENAHLPIASMCKIMTLILCFDAVNNGVMTLDEKIQISENASGMGGSQVFLETGGEYTVEELLKSIIVCSANDSCVAMAEKIAGSEDLFVEKMNERAKELGADNTLFSNCTGLPKDPQYSSAKDVALMLCELTKNEEYFHFSRIWMDRFHHPKGRFTDITNTNKLIRFYDGCDGGKTGFTNQAGFCLAATAIRGGMRIISVVIGEDSSKNRFSDMRTMFDYAFATYTLKTVVDQNNPLSEQIQINGGKSDYLSVRPERDSFIFSKRGNKENVSLDVQLSESVKAPIKAGDKVGTIVIYRDNIETDRVSIIANESVAAANFFDRFRVLAKNWKL